MDEILTETISFSDKQFVFAEPPRPKEIGSGMVKSLLGKGGTAYVYEIWNPKLEITRAVKLWRPMHSEQARRRFENEIKITAKLHHPNIVEIYAVGEWAGLPFIEMEKIDGLNLKELLDEHENLPEEVATAIALTLCRALMYAHNHEYSIAGTAHRGVIHCDMKPANIMIAQNGCVKLMDFGIAHPSSGVSDVEKNSVTGSLQYMSPEQLRSKPVDQRSDLFSLGVLLYELYSGIKAFPAITMQELLQKRSENAVVALSDFCADLPPRVCAIVEKAMEIEPENRYQTAHELYHDLYKTYRRKTHISPEGLIAKYLDGDDLTALKAAYSIPSYYKTIGIALIPFLLFFSVFTFRSHRRHVALAPIERVADSTAILASTVKKTAVVVAPAISEAKPMAPPVAPPHRKLALSGGAASKPRTKTRQVGTIGTNRTIADSNDKTTNPGEVLNTLKGLVAAGKLNQAEKMFKAFPLQDGEYYLLYAEVLLQRHLWAVAREEADKALRIPSSRMAPAEAREKVLFLKARSLTGEFDAAGGSSVGREAMEAWFDLKYLYRTNTAHPRYIKADAEIRRISAAL